MKRVMSSMLCGCMITVLLAGCGQTTGDTPTSVAADTAAVSEAAEETTEKASAPEETTANEGAEIKIWHDNDERIMETIAGRVNEILKADGISVSFEKKSGLTDQLKLYGNDAENGPDMYLFAHDSLGTFVEMGVVAPLEDVIDVSTMSNLVPMTVEAGKYKETQYLMPVYFETLLFMYNKDLWIGEVPSTSEKLYEYMKANTDTNAGTYALVNQHTNAYNVSPYIYGYGGYIIDKDGNPGLDDAKTMEAVAYNKKFAQLEADGDYNTVTTLFNEGKASAIIGGPWLVPGINDAGINLGIKSLSEITLPNGNPMSPFAGVQSIGVMKYAAENKKDAVAKVLAVVSGEEVGIDLAKKANCAPANIQAYEDADVAGNEMITAIRKTAETADPMPNIPQMGVMWGPTESFLTAVNKNDADVNEAAEQFQKEALTAIEDMQ